MGLGEKDKGIKQKKNPKNKKQLIGTDNSIVIARGKRRSEEAEEGRSEEVRGGRRKGGINDDTRRLDFVWWTHNTIHRRCIIEVYT